MTKLSLTNQRLIPVTMEPRGSVAEFDKASGRITLHTSCQNPAGLQKTLAENILKLPMDKVRVRVPDVGGGFGMKTMLYPEDAVCAYAARKLGRPMHWGASRSEEFLAGTHGRDQTNDRRTGVRRRWQDPGPAGRHRRQRRRLRLQPGGHHRPGDRAEGDHRRLPCADAGPARQGGADAYQHRLGLSRRRPPGGDLSHRAPDGPGGRGDEDGSGGAAPAQPDPVHRHALYHADGRDVRQRQLREHSAAHPDASRLGRLSAAARGVAQARTAARPRAVLVPGVDRCRARRDARLPRRGGRTRRRLHRDAGHGPGHRDQLRADHRRQRWTSTPRQW